uniref:Vacuolar protein sorting-associated protein 37A-like n=1 Tax=Saccoglossus kowalevskii TaxID=10224 RepID=A0ABM0MAC1_SACKO|nr:PREDICTED: vacuolar protein sorting-associated protein 37A-like [Saccoglossus kowalevskii]
MIFGTEHPQCTPPSQLPYTPQPQAAAPFVAPYPVNPISTVPSGMNYIPQIPMPTLTTSSPVPMSCSYTMPTVPTSFPDLHSKTVSQLQAFNAEEHILAEYSLNLPQMKKLQVDRLDLCNANEDLAKINLRKKPYLESQKEELRQKYEILEQLRKQFDIDCQKQQTLSERYNPSNLLTHLKIASAEAEEESEKIADLFLDKQIDIESFVQQFMEKRKLCHTRKGKEEKLMQLADRRY